MKLLILFSFFILSSAYSNEVSDEGLGQKFVGVLKEKEITQNIGLTKEVQECRDKSKFTANQTPTDQQLKDAIDCFKTTVLNKYKNNPKGLADISSALELEKYNLVKSKNSTEITAYLSDRLYESLTGVNPKEKDQQKIIDQLKFKNRKFADQKIFFELYQTQLQKSALFEVSRFCFENLRLTGSQGTEFETHWQDFFTTGNAKDFLATKGKDIIDTGSQPFGLSNVNFTDKDQTKLQDEIFKSMGNLQSPDKVSAMGQFFIVCLNSMNTLCNEYEQQGSATTTNVVNTTTMPKGGNACLARGRLEKIRKSVAATEEILSKHFVGNKSPQSEIVLQEKDIMLLATGDKSIDNLTVVSSKEILDAYNQDSIKDIEKCADPANAKSKECEQFIDVGDDLAKAKNNMELDYAFKKETEKTKVSELKQDPNKLKEYLTENGYISLLEKWEKDPSKINIEEEVGKIIEAKRVAAITDLQSRLGKRQLSESDAKDTQKKETYIVDNAKYALEEKARLAQVVLFSNIITSQLEIKQGTETLGRNVSGVKKELSGLGNDVNKDLFEGLQSTVDNNKGQTSNNGGFGDGLGIIDVLLGGPQSK